MELRSNSHPECSDKLTHPFITSCPGSTSLNPCCVPLIGLRCSISDSALYQHVVCFNRQLKRHCEDTSEGSVTSSRQCHTSERGTPPSRGDTQVSWTQGRETAWPPRQLVAKSKSNTKVALVGLGHLRDRWPRSDHGQVRHLAPPRETPPREARLSEVDSRRHSEVAPRTRTRWWHVAFVRALFTETSSTIEERFRAAQCASRAYKQPVGELDISEVIASIDSPPTPLGKFQWGTWRHKDRVTSVCGSACRVLAPEYDKESDPPTIIQEQIQNAKKLVYRIAENVALSPKDVASRVCLRVLLERTCLGPLHWHSVEGGVEHPEQA